MSNKILGFFEDACFEERWGFLERENSLFKTRGYYFFYIPEHDVMLGCSVVHMNAYKFYAPITCVPDEVYRLTSEMIHISSGGAYNQTCTLDVVTPYIPIGSNSAGKEWLFSGNLWDTDHQQISVPTVKTERWGLRLCLWYPSSSRK